jgi:hypothetical protein
MKKVAWQCLAAVVAGVAAAGALVLIFPPKARAAEKAVIVDCGALAENITSLADFRDTGTRLELVVRLARKRQGDGPAEQAVLEREIRRMWREGLDAEDAGHAVYKRCKAQLGDMGRDA